MVRKEMIPWNTIPADELLAGADRLARQYGISSFWYWNGTPYFWYWKGTDRTGHELVLGWYSKN